MRKLASHKNIFPLNIFKLNIGHILKNHTIISNKNHREFNQRMTQKSRNFYTQIFNPININSGTNSYVFNSFLNPFSNMKQTKHLKNNIHYNLLPKYCNFTRQYTYSTFSKRNYSLESSVANSKDQQQNQQQNQQNYRRPSFSTKNILVTSALPYVNNVPHLGNLIGAILSADIYTKYLRLYDPSLRNVRFICGTDEYGTATETRARRDGVHPEQLCSEFYSKHKELYEWFEIKFDAFGRTSQGNYHKDIIGSIYKDLEDQNMFFEKEIHQWYCDNDKMFLADRFVKGECPSCGTEANGDQCDSCGKVFQTALELHHPKCSICSHEPIVKNTNHLFLDVQKGMKDLSDWIQNLWNIESLKNSELPSVSWSTVAKGITQGTIKSDLPPRCITRDLKWGVPVPYHDKRGNRLEDKVFYVWFDAPIGYISIFAEHFSDWKDWWFTRDLNTNQENPKVSLIQFMGKDNVPFHSVYFPLVLMSTKKPWKLVDAIVSTHYLNYEDGKFSKSKGTGVFCDAAKSSGIPSSYWRFYLVTVRPELGDSTFQWTDFVDKVNNVLLAKFGNYFNRITKFAASRFEGKIPKRGTLLDRDLKFIEDVNQLLNEYVFYMEQARIKDGQQACINIAQTGNQYMQDMQPWSLIKTDKDRASTVVNLNMQVLALLSLIIKPFMPTISNQMQKQLNISEIHFQTEKPSFNINQLQEGHQLGELSILIEKIDSSIIDIMKSKYGPFN